MKTSIELPEPDGMDNDDTGYYTADQMREYAALVRADENEACALIADEAEPYQAADLIRARGNT